MRALSDENSFCACKVVSDFIPSHSWGNLVSRGKLFTLNTRAVISRGSLQLRGASRIATERLRRVLHYLAKFLRPAENSVMQIRVRHFDTTRFLLLRPREYPFSIRVVEDVWRKDEKESESSASSPTIPRVSAVFMPRGFASPSIFLT